MLEIRHLTKTFNAGTANEVKALAGLSCTVADESFVVLLGTNGSGKSTLLNAVAGTFRPDGGAILLNGKDLSKWPEHRRARHFGRVFQNPFAGTAPEMTIAENLALAARRGRFPGLGWALPGSARRAFRDRVQSLGMGLEERLDAPIGKLSGGQRQALSLLMATWERPSLLLLDEHTAALDPRSAAKVVKLTQEMVRSGRLTTLMVTHSMQQAVAMGDRILMLHQGRIVHDIGENEKRRLKVSDLLALFDDIRRREQVDLSAAELLRQSYV